MFFGAIASLLLAACGPVSEGPVTTPRPGSDASFVDDAAAPDAAAPDDVTADITRDASAPDVATVDTAPAADVAPIPCGAPSYTCPVGYRCVGLSTTQCVRAAALGEPCSDGPSAPVYCVPGASCEPGPDVPRCAAYGTAFGQCRNTDCAGRCDPGLGCDPSTHCRPGLPVGALCGGDGDFCNDGSSCQDVNGTARCVADGAAGGYCHDDRSCDVGLRCRGSNSGAAVGCNRTYFHCVSGPLPGEACEPAGERCNAGTSCMRSLGAMRCVAAPDGTPGGRCRAESPRCDETAVCDDRGWSCVRRVARGMACDPTGGTTACAAGDTCTGEHLADGGQCVAAGTAPGADCRTSEPHCDGMLQCSDFSRYRRTCRTLARAGDLCDLGGVRTLCPTPTRCVPATVSSGGVPGATCATPVAEVEPNDRSVAARAVVTRSTLYQASLSAADVEDCHALRMPTGSALYVESTIPLVARLFRASGVEVGRWTMRPMSWGGPLGGSARLDPATIGVLRDLIADDYLLCVRALGDPTSRREPVSYTLALGVLPRSW